MRTHTFLSVGVSALTLLLLLVSSFYPAVVSAQAIRGSIRGMVTDPSGAGIPAASVAITNIANQRLVDNDEQCGGQVQRAVPPHPVNTR